jgi:hypothetical protein
MTEATLGARRPPIDHQKEPDRAVEQVVAEEPKKWAS